MPGAVASSESFAALNLGNAAPGATVTTWPSLAADNSPASPFYGLLYMAYTDVGSDPGVVERYCAAEGLAVLERKS